MIANDGWYYHIKMDHLTQVILIRVHNNKSLYNYTNYKYFLCKLTVNFFIAINIFR